MAAPHSPDGDAIQWLASMYMFKTVPRASLNALLEEAPPVVYAAGHVIFRQGDTASIALLVLEGELVAEVQGPKGPHKLGTSGPGEIVGEQGIFVPGGLRSATVTASRPTVCLVLEPELMDQAAHNPAVVAMEQHLLGTLARRIRRTNQAIQHVWKAGTPAADPATGDAAPTRVAALRSWFSGIFGGD